MKRMPIIAFVAAAMMLVACSKPEVVPAPENRADTKIDFQAVINGTDVEWTKNVNGYFADPTTNLVYDSATGSNAYQYYSTMRSNDNLSWISLGLGSIIHDPEVSENVTIDAFKAFFSVDSTYTWSDSALDGVELKYADASGREYRTKPSFPGSITFNSFEFLQDDNGDYIQFEADFDATLYAYESDTITANMQGATFIGYFKR